MYLPLAGINPDEERLRKMKINSAPPVSQHKIVQPLDPADQAQQRLEKINQDKLDASIVAEKEEKFTSDAENRHWSAPSLSTQDFLSLRELTATSRANSDDPFRILDEVIARLKERVEMTGEILEAIQKMKEQTDPDNLALQLLVKTLDAMDSNNAKQK